MIFREGDFWWRERWPATIATLVAIGLFWLSNGPSAVIIFLLVVWFLGYFFTGRIPATPAITWATRLVLYMIVYFGNVGHDTNLVDNVFVAQWMTIFGQFAIAEFAIRRWRAGDVPLWADILPSGVIMLAACSTLEPLYVTFLAPLYFLFMVLSFAQIGHRADAALPWRWLNLGTRILSLLLAIAIGGFAHYCFRQYKSEILDWGGNVLGEHVASAAKQFSITGISKSPQLGPTFNSGSPPTRMLLIHGTLGSPYMRGMSYTDYLRGSWGPALDSRRYVSIGQDQLSMPTSAKSSSVEVERLVPDDDMVSIPLECSAIQVPRGDVVTWAQNDGGPIKVTDIGSLKYRCALPMQTDGFQGIMCATPNAAQRQRLLTLPIGIDQRVIDLGKSLAHGHGGVRGIRAVEQYLMTNNRYSYATDPGSGDPVSNFILEHKSADCEYFASAATILLRAGGIPTRFVIGYYAHESGPDGTVVRATDAHAWAESYIGTGWQTVDATPASGRPDVTQKLDWWWRFRDRLDDFLSGVRNRWSTETPLQKALSIACLGLIFGVYYAVRSWHVTRQTAARRYGYTRASPTYVELSDRFDRLLKNRRAACPIGTPWREHVQDLANEDPAPIRDTELVATFVSAYSEARFGTDASAETAIKLSEMLDKLESEKR